MQLCLYGVVINAGGRYTQKYTLADKEKEKKMENKKFGLGILTMVLVFGMTTVGCGDGGGGDSNGGGGGSAFLGETLNLSGQVWRVLYNYDNLIYEEFTENSSINAGFWSFYDDHEAYIDIGGSGSITNGQLSFSIDTPTETESIQSFFSYFSQYFSNFSISPSATRSAPLFFNVDKGSLDKTYIDNNIEEYVLYIYVDRDVTITGGAKTTTIECDCIEHDDYCYCEENNGSCDCAYPLMTRNLSINLKTGWNVITRKTELNKSTQTETFTLSTGDSSRTKWALEWW